MLSESAQPQPPPAVPEISPLHRRLLKAIWKLGQFLRDFLYDPELLSQDEVDERALCGLTGVVKISLFKYKPPQNITDGKFLITKNKTTLPAYM